MAVSAISLPEPKNYIKGVSTFAKMSLYATDIGSGATDVVIANIASSDLFVRRVYTRVQTAFPAGCRLDIGDDADSDRWMTCGLVGATTAGDSNGYWKTGTSDAAGVDGVAKQYTEGSDQSIKLGVSNAEVGTSGQLDVLIEYMMIESR